MRNLFQSNRVVAQSLQIICVLFILSHSLKGQSHDSHHDHHEDHAHRNHIALFAGLTSQYHLGKNITSLGVDYMRFFKHHSNWGLSASTEIILAKDIQWLIVTPVVYKPLKNIWLRTGPGFELVRNEQDKIIGTFVMRFGMGYDININKLVISPSFDFDFIRYHPAIVWGVNIGMGF